MEKPIKKDIPRLSDKFFFTDEALPNYTVDNFFKDFDTFDKLSDDKDIQTFIISLPLTDCVIKLQSIKPHLLIESQQYENLLKKLQTHPKSIFQFNVFDKNKDNITGKIHLLETTSIETYIQKYFDKVSPKIINFEINVEDGESVITIQKELFPNSIGIEFTESFIYMIEKNKFEVYIWNKD